MDQAPLQPFDQDGKQGVLQAQQPLVQPQLPIP